MKKISIEKYYNIKEMLRSKNSEDWVVACTVLEQIPHDEKNHLFIKLLLKFSSMGSHWIKENHPVLYDELNSDKDAVFNANYTYNELFKSIKRSKTSVDQVKVLVEEFSQATLDILTNMGYDFIEEINIKYKDE
jgi:hypothetical protein